MAYYASDANALWNRVQDKAANIARASGLTRWDDTRRRFNQETSDLNNYMGSGDWSTDRTNEFRSSATKAVEDLTNEMARYGTSTKEYKQLKNYKTYYENALGQFDRMDVVSNTQNYIGNWGDNGFDNWHSEDEYNTQRQYLDDQRNQLQSQIDETEKKMKEKGEYYNADLETLKSYRDMYDQLSEGLDYRHEWDKQYPTVEAFTASQKSQDYNYSSQLETTLAEKQAELQQKYEELSRLEAEFGAPSQNLGNALGNMFAGMTGAAGTSASAARRNPEGYQHMLELKDEVAKLREEYDAAAKDLELVQYYQNQTILNNIGRYDPKVDWKAEVDQLKEDRDRAKEMGDEESYAKIDRQIKFLAGEKEDGTDANGLYDDETYLGQWHLQNIDVEKDRAEYEDIERQLQEMGAATYRGGNWLNIIGAGLADAANGQAGIATDKPLSVSAWENATDENVLDLQRRKKELNQNLESAEKYQGRTAKSDWYNNLDEGQQAKLVELGQAAVSEDGKSYQNAQGGKTSLKNFAYLDEKTDEDLRDLVYAAIGAELTGADIGFTVEDILADYEKRLNQAQGFAQAKKDDEIQSALGHWFKTVPRMSIQSGLNQFFEGVPGYFTDELRTPNAMTFRDQYNRAFLAKYGDERLFADSAVGGSNINQLIYDVGKTTGNMLPSIVASSLLSLAGMPEAGAGAIGATIMGLSSAGNTYQQALAEGWDKDDARLFSTITGAAEGGLQYILGGISKLGGKGAEPLLKMTERINDAGIRIATRTAIKGLSETTEELLQNRLERDLRSWLNDEDPVSFFEMTSDDWYTVLVTMISTGLLEGPGEVINTAKAGKLGNQLAGNTIPSKGILKSTQERNAIIREIGETMKGDEALAYTLVRVGTELTEPGTTARTLADGMQSGKIEKNATNYGRLYNAIIEAYVESDGKIGATAAMRAVMGGAVVYNELTRTQSLKEQENARTAEIKKNNPGAEVLGENATALRELGLNDTATAIECGAIVNKVMSGSELSAAEMNRVTGNDLAGRAMRVLLGRYLGTLTDSTPADVTKAVLNAAREEMKVEQQRQEDLKSMSVVEAALKAADKVRVARSAANASIQQATWQDEDQAWNEGSVLDKAVAKKPGKTVDWRYDGRTAQQPAVADSVAQDMQQNAQKIADLEQQQKLLESMSFEQAAKYHFQGLDGAMAEMEQMKALQTRLAELNAEAAKLAQNRFPSKDQRTSLADINAERNKILGQQMALMSKYAKMMRDAAEKKAAEAKAAEKAAPAKPAQNSSGEEVAVLPGGAQLTRAEYLEQMKGKMTEERANALFDSYLAATKKGNVENGQQQNANPDQRRADVGNETDSGQDRAGSVGEDAETLRQRLEQSVGLVDRNGTEAARVELSAVQTDGRSTELLEKDYEGIAEFANLLYDIGFDRVTFLTHGQMMDAAGKYVPALYYNGELFLSLDYGDPGYDYKAYAKHEVAHRLVDFYRAFFNDQKAAWFVANAVQSLTKSAEEYNALFKEYAQRYRIYRSIEGITDQEFVNMVNEEILADMAGGLHGKGEYVDAVDAFFKASGFNDVTSKIKAKDKNPGDVQILDGLNESEMPYNTPVDTLMSTANVDSPSTTVVPANQVSRLAYAGLMNALGFFVNKPGIGEKGEKKAYRTAEDAAARQNAITTVTVEDIKNSPVGEMIRYAQNNGFLSEDPEEAARIAEAEYKLFAGIGSVSEQTNDFYMAMQFIGSALFTAMKTNADKQYNTTYDPASVCTKTQAVIDDMSAQMVDLKRGLYQDEILEIYRSQFEAGNPVPCPECYVFTHWVGIGGLLENIYKYQSKYAELSPEEVVQRYNELFQDVTDDLNDKVKPLKEELANPNTTPERAEEIKLLLKKNTFGKTRRKLIEQAEKGLAGIQDKLEKGLPLTPNEIKNRSKWEKHADNLAALSWIKTVYFGGKDVKAKNANITVKENGEKILNFYVPTDILFDLNRGEEFAAKYKDAWAFRTTQGAGYGKAIAPYAEATLGEGILVTKSQDNIKKKMVGELNQLFLTERGEIEGKKKGTRGEALSLTREKQLNQLFIGGQRLQSTSDTRYDNASDYLLIALEMQTMHGGVQVYTKVPGAVHFFELCGMCSNMSLMPKGGGLEKVGDELVPVDTSTGGMNPQTAQDLRKENPHAGTITIGVNDRHIRAMMNQFFRDFIIPYHASGGNADLIAKFRAIQEGLDPSKSSMPKSSDYTKTQNDKILSDAILKEDLGYSDAQVEEIHRFRQARLYLLTKYASDKKAGREVPAEIARMWSVDGIGPDDARYRSRMILQNLYRSMTDGQWQGVKIKKDIVEGQIFPNEFWDTNVSYEDSGVNTENYLAYCEALGFLHRFSGQGVAMKKATRSDGSFTVRNQVVPIKGRDYDGSEVMLTDLAYQVNEDGSYKLDKNGDRMIEPYFWKVLVDRRMYDNDGNYLPQPYVSLAGLVGNGTDEDINTGVNAVVSKTEGIAHPMGNRPYNRKQSLATAATPVAERQAKRAFRDTITSYADRDNNQPMTRVQKGQGRYALGMDDPGYETSKREAPVTDDRGQVLYVEPTSSGWKVDRDTDGSLLNTDYLKNELGLEIFDNPRDAYEVEKRSSVIPEKSDQKHGTANPSTAPSYAQAFDYLQEKHGDNAKNLHVLDASSGLGHGTKLGRDTLFKGNEKNIVELEPFPGNRQVDYRNYGGLIAAIEAGEEEPFDFIISNAVINVMAQDAREELLSSLLRMLKPGGQLYINPAFSKTWKIGNTPISLAKYEQMRSNGEDVSGKNVMLAPATDTTGQEVYVNGSHSVQKGYTPSEFKAFAEDVAKQALGEEITIQNGNSKDVPGINKGFIITRGEKTEALTERRKNGIITRFATAEQEGEANFERLKGALENVDRDGASERGEPYNSSRELERLAEIYRASEVTRGEDRRLLRDAIRRAGGIAQRVDKAYWGENITTEVVSPEYYTTEMINAERGNKEHGIDTVFFVGYPEGEYSGEWTGFGGYANTDLNTAFVKIDSEINKESSVRKGFSSTRLAAHRGNNSVRPAARHERFHLLAFKGNQQVTRLLDYVSSEKNASVFDEINFWYQRTFPQDGYDFYNYAEEVAADLYAGELTVEDKKARSEVTKLIADIDKGAQHGARYALGEDENNSSNPYPPDTLEHDFLAALESGDPTVLENWLNQTMNDYTDSLENSKVRPPVIPTKGFVPKVSEQEKAALENKRKSLIKAKGAMRESEKSNGNVMPKKDEANRPFRRNVQNVWSAEQIPQDAQDALERFAFTDIQATYVPDSNKQLIKNAKNEIAETGDLEKSKAQFAKIARDSFDHLVTPQDIAFGEQLLIETSRQGDMQGFLDTLASLVEMSTTAGKTLQAFRLLKQSGPIGQLYYIEKVVNRLQSNLLKRGYNIDIKVDPDLSKAVVFAETDAERNEAMEALKMSIAKQLPVTFKDRIDAWRYLSMLGNARTHIRNVLGNAIFVPLRYTKDVMKAGGEYLAVKTGLIQQEDRTTALKVSQEWKDFARDQAEVWKAELQGNGKYNPAREILDMRKVLPGVLDTISRINSNGIGEGHGIWSKLLIGLEGEDWIFLRPAFTKTLAAVLQNSGYTVDQIRTSNDVEVRQAYNRAIKLAIEEAQKATYRDFSVVASALNRMKRMEGNSKASKFAGVLLEGLLPFTKTPINILRRGVEYSPIGLLTSIVGTLNDVAHKNLNATQAIDSICSGLSGTAIFAIGWLMARMGWLRGKRDDEKEEEFEKLQGYQDYSLQIGKASFTIDWAAPAALPLFAGAAMKDLMDNDGEFNLIADGWNAMMMLAEPMMSLSMLDGLNSVLTTASYSKGNQKIAEIGKSMFTSYLGQFVPTIAGQAARSVDGTRRQTYVDKNSVIPPAAQRFIQSSVQNKVPFWESQKAPYVDQWGRQSTTSSKLLSAAENFFAPWYRSMVNTTYVDEQLTALHNSKELDSTEKNSILPSLPGKDFKVAGETKYLTADEYVSYATDIGQTKYTLLSSLLSDPRYLNLTDTEKAKAISYIYKYANAVGKYHLDNRYDLHNNAGVWVEEAEAAKTDYERFEIIWKKIADALED